MTDKELKKIISQGENTETQIKCCVDDAYKIATETDEFVITMTRDETLEENSSVHDSVYDNDHDGNYDKKILGVHDSVYDGVYDSDHDGNYDSNYDKKILTFTMIPRSRKEIMGLLDISTHTKNYERYIVPLLEKGLLAMTLPNKPKSKNQKYVTTQKGHEKFVNRTIN
jgi:hypothetical protein